MKRNFIAGAIVSVVCTLTAAGCGKDDDLPNDSPSVGTVLDQKVLLVGEANIDVTLAPNRVPSRVLIPQTALPAKRLVTMRVSTGVTREGATPANGSTFQVATQNVSFSPATPVRLQQRVPPAPPRKQYVAVTAAEGDAAWVRRSPARVVPAGSPGAPSASDAAVDDNVVVEIDVLGSGLWAIVLEDDQPDAGTDVDAGAWDVPDGTDAGSSQVDGSVARDADPVTPPRVTAVLPSSGVLGQAASVTVSGSDFATGAQVTFDGVAVPTTALADGSLRAEVPAARTSNAGQLAIWVDNRPGDTRTRSNTLYFTVTPPPGAPVVLDYSPDNAVPGDKVTIVATNLADQPLTITDSAGHAALPGAVGTITWASYAAQTVEFTLPADFVTGPLTVANALGSFRGKTFHVGANLSRLPGTIASSSSEYNTTNWSTKSGADNELRTSWFTARGDCASLPTCTKKPFYQVTFAQPQSVGRIAIRGNREYESGYDFLRARFEILDAAGGVLWGETYDLPAPDRDLDVFLPAPVLGASSVRFSSESDQSDEPGFSELEVFGP